MKTLLVLFTLLLAGIASADGHEQEAAPVWLNEVDADGNPAGFGDVQNPNWHLGTFLPDSTFQIGVFWKRNPTLGDSDRVTQLAYAFATESPWISLPTGVDSFAPNQLNPLADMMVDPGTGEHFINLYQHTRTIAGTGECPGCNRELAFWLVDDRFSSDAPHDPEFEPGIPINNEPIGWMSFAIHPFTPPGKYTVSLYRGWVKSGRPFAETSYLCGTRMDDDPAEINVLRGCDGPKVWEIEEHDASSFTFYVVDAKGGVCDADFNGDGIVNFGDWGLFGQVWGTNSETPADMDGDGVVGISDFGIFRSFYGLPCPL